MRHKVSRLRGRCGVYAPISPFEPIFAFGDLLNALLLSWRSWRRERVANRRFAAVYLREVRLRPS